MSEEGFVPWSERGDDDNVDEKKKEKEAEATEEADL